MSKRDMINILATMILMVWVAIPALAQVSIDTVDRSVRVLVWEDQLGDGGSEYFESADRGGFDEEATTSMASVSCRSSQLTTASEATGGITLGGEFSAQTQQLLTGTRHTMFSGAYLIADFTVTSLCDYQLELNVLANSGALNVAIVNQTTSATVLSPTTDLGSFVYSGQFTDAAQYRLIVSTTAQAVSTEVVYLDSALTFDLTVVESGAVATEYESWSMLKALFR